MENYHESRAWERMSLAHTLLIAETRDAEFRIVDVSLGGLGATSRRPLPEQNRIEATLENTFLLTLEVKYCRLDTRPEALPGTYRIGLRFADPLTARAFNHWIASLPHPGETPPSATAAALVEKRREKRFPVVDAGMQVWLGNMPAVVVDIADGGIGLLTHHPLSPGETFHIRTAEGEPVPLVSVSCRQTDAHDELDLDVAEFRIGSRYAQPEAQPLLSTLLMDRYVDILLERLGH